ncbi:hypothetical protein [Nocardia takedensis]|uniref:hypothetical protein n=1 Tax=Nocardia takedensis TaxID=259390 RepID=UPI0012F67234|nr:hypothetical protein [Nocardia takedensis]
MSVPAPVAHRKVGGGLTWKGTILVIAGLAYSWMLMAHGMSPTDAAKTAAATIGTLLVVVVAAPPVVALCQELSRRIGTPGPQQGVQ